MGAWGLGAGWAGMKLTINVYLDGATGDLLLLPGHNYQNPGCHFRPIIARGEPPLPSGPLSAQQRFVINKAEIALFIHAGGRYACVWLLELSTDLREVFTMPGECPY